MGNLVVRPHALSEKGMTVISLESDYTVSKLIESLKFDDAILPYVMVQINGVELPPSLWATVTPKQHSHVLIAVVPRGGNGDSKGGIRMLATLVLAFYAPGWGQSIVGATEVTLASSLVSAGIMIAGQLALNAIFPPPSLNNTNLANDQTESPTLSISGQQNSARPFSPVARIYGKHRHWPMHAAEPFVQTIGGTTQYLYMLFDFGYGPLKLSDHRIGDQPISQFEGIELVVHESMMDGSGLLLYTRDVTNSQHNVNLVQSVPQTFSTAAGVDAAQVDIVFDSGLVKYNATTGAKESSAASFSIDFKKSSDAAWSKLGECRSFGTSRDAYYNENFGNVPAHGVFNSYDYFGSSPVASTLYSVVRFKGGLIDVYDDYDPSIVTGGTPKVYGFKAGSSSLVVDIVHDVFSGSSFFINGKRYTVTNDVLGVHGVTNRVLNISPPLYDDLVTSSYVQASGGQIQNPNYWSGVSVSMNNIGELRFSDRTSESFTFSFLIGFPTAGQYDIKITRLDVVEPDQYTKNSSIVAALKSFKNQSPINFSKPHTVVEMKIRATDQLNGIISDYSAVASSILDQWNGSAFVQGETSNPAWVCLDVLRGKSTPRPIADNKIDLDKFKQWAAWCNTTAPDNSESYFRCDHVVDYQTTVKQLFDSLASTGRGASAIIDGKYSVIYDQLKTVPCQLITTHNSNGFSATRSFSDVPHAIKVRFVDPDSDWQQNELIVYDDGYNAGNATIFEDLPLVGVARQTQAWRDGRYYLAQAKLRQEEFTISMDIENISFMRGDYVQFQHDVAKIGGAPSRIIDISGNTVTVSEPFGTLNIPTLSYAVKIREADNLIKSYNIVSGGGNSAVLSGTLTASIGDLLSWGEVGFVVDDFIVKSIIPEDDMKATVKLVALAPAVYTSDTGAIPAWQPKLSRELSASPPIVLNLSVIQTVSYINRQPAFSILINWDESSAEIYEIYLYRGGRWDLLDTTRNTEHYFIKDYVGSDFNGTNILGVLHEFKVLGVSATGKKLKLNEIPSVTITPAADTTPPGPVQNFQLDVVTESIQLTWNAPPDPDLEGYFFRYSTDTVSPDWESSMELVPMMPHNANSLTVNARTGSYLIRAVDTNGNLGPVSSARTTIPSLINLNLVHTVDEAPTWLGLKDNVEIVSSKLRLVNASVVGYYYFMGGPSFAAAYPSRITHSLDATGILLSDSSLAAADTWALRVEVRLQETAGVISDWATLSSVTFMSEAGASWTDWKPFTIADYTGANYDFRLAFSSLDGLSSPEVTEAVITVDMVDRIASGNNVVSGTGGYTVAFDPYFYDTPSIAVTAENMTAGDYYTIDNKGIDGFDIEFFNSGSTSVNRTFDWYAKGYGALSPNIIG